MADCHAELLVEPFTEGVLGPHVEAAIGALDRTRVAVDVGAFSTAINGESTDVLASIEAAIDAGIAAGASTVRVTMSVSGGA